MDSIPILDHGYLKLVETWGADEAIVAAARMSTGKGFLGWEPGHCPTCGGSGTVWDGTVGSGDYLECRDCVGKGAIPGDMGLLRRLWVKKHATPFEMAGLVVEVAAPIMVFREWHRHRTQSYSEMSARYTPLPDVCYIPTVERLLVNQGTRNRQAGTVEGAEVLNEAGAEQYRNELAGVWDAQEAFYRKWLKAGVPKELARSHLGVGRYSRMRASANLRNWLGFLTLRMAPDAQHEIRVYACAVGEIIAEHFPRTWSLFLEGRTGV